MASSKCGFTYFCCAFLCCSEASSVSCVVQERAGVKWKEATKKCLPPLSEKTVLIQKETENKIAFFLVHETLKTRFFRIENVFRSMMNFAILPPTPWPHSSIRKIVARVKCSSNFITSRRRFGLIGYVYQSQEALNPKRQFRFVVLVYQRSDSTPKSNFRKLEVEYQFPEVGSWNSKSQSSKLEV